MRKMHSVSSMGILALTGWFWGTGSVVTAIEATPEAKPESPPVQRAKEPDTKPKESDPKSKESDSKAVEQKPKEADVKSKEGEVKAKETEAKPKDTEVKVKESPGKLKESESKAKEADQKQKDSDTKLKDSDAAPDNPCLPLAHVPESKTDAPAAPADSAAGERPKTAEPEGKKQPIRSTMVAAKLALMADPRLLPYEIEVDAKDKDLVLLGKVSQESDKKAAMDIVRCLEGVHAVENRLKVESDAEHGLVSERDKALTQLVKERFEKSKTLQSVKFDVKTEDGVVTLSGSTRFQIIVLEAAQAARQIPGVRAVNTDAVRLAAGE